ncbi:MAG: helix-turn-helix domain-containing protein [Bacteroidia bacterium]|nr:helix-turn-helix domain-containing protein [Bacteroidia bacterium]
MKNIQRAIQNEIERRVRLENGHQNAGARCAMVKVKREMAEFRKELRCLKDELAEICETVSGTARPKHLAVPRVDGAGIRKLRKKNELTAKEFAAILGVSLETVSRWETGKQRIRSAHKKAVANLRNLGKRAIRKMLAEAMRVDCKSTSNPI